MTEIQKRLENLRQEMLREHIDAIVIPNSDPHNSEYVAEHWQSRTWISGFTGSAGTVVVTHSEAALWTDSRYFLQAASQLHGTGIDLMKEGLAGTPSITEWLLRKLSASNSRTLAIDGKVTNYSAVVGMEKALRRIGVSVRTNYDAMKMLWRDRPAVPAGMVYAVSKEYIGETVCEKLERLRMEMRRQHCDGHILTDLMGIAWMLNLRGSDLDMTPVFMSNLFIGLDEAVLFCDGTLTTEAQAMMAEAGVLVRPYAAFAGYVGGLTDRKIMCDSTTTCHAVYNVVKDHALDIPSPVIAFKAVKNAREIEGFRNAMVRDGVAMVRFLRWLKPAVEAGGQTEITVSNHLEALRHEDAACTGLSFDTICGYNAHGAIVHYSATSESEAQLKPEGLLLLDSGGQYVDGTTDITRTIALGPLTDEMRRVYTYVLKANIAMATSVFPEGINGTQIDAIARSVVWQGGYNYLHGTGHGVGWRLCVHEGPHGIRQGWTPAPLHAGMTVTDEPGIYLAGKFGVRIENTMLITEAPGVSMDGETAFLRMQPLTLCPIDTTPLVRDMLTEAELSWLNDYHNRVREVLLPHLTEEADRQWLTEATKQL